MSSMTYESFLRLHLKQLENIQYKSGYEYAKQRLAKSFQTMDLAELFIFLRSLREDGYNNRNYYAVGQAHAILEIIRARLDGAIIVTD